MPGYLKRALRTWCLGGGSAMLVMICALKSEFAVKRLVTRGNLSVSGSAFILTGVREGFQSSLAGMMIIDFGAKECEI